MKIVEGSEMSQIKKVIIADDYKLIRERVKELLSSVSTCKVLAEASNGKEAVELISSLKPDVVILDIKMPDMTGIEVLQAVQELLHDMTVIIFSNYSSLQYQSKCIELGADHYLDKTKDFERLKSILL